MLVVICMSLHAQCVEDIIKTAHTKSVEADVKRLEDHIYMLRAQIQAMESEIKFNEAKAAEKAAIEKRSKELGCEVEATTGACKPK